jgi:hypothetical protein
MYLYSKRCFCKLSAKITPHQLKGRNSLSCHLSPEKARRQGNLTRNTQLSRKSYIAPAWPSESALPIFNGCQLD